MKPQITPSLCVIYNFCSIFAQFTRVDAGYTSTDYVTNLLKNKRECRFLSITNADNVYGSDVVANVLNYSVDKVTKTPPDMLLAPLDSRNFAEHGA